MNLCMYTFTCTTVARTVVALLATLGAGAVLAQQVCHPNIPRTRPDTRYEAVAGATPAGSEVRDKVTGLVWRRCVEGMTWTGSTCTGTAGSVTWVQALDQARLAVATTASPATVWRVPNHKELYSLPERACYNPAINTTWFPADPGNGTWSSSPYANGSDYAWYVYFGSGYDYYDYESSGMSVRLVRSGQ